MTSVSTLPAWWSDLDAVLFDLDDTLLDRDAAIREFAERLADRYAGDLEPGSADRLVLSFPEWDQRGFRPRDAVYRDLVYRLSWRQPPDPEDFLHFWFTVFPECAVPMTGLTTVLTALHEQGIRIGIVTNSTPRLQYPKIDRLGIRQLLSAILISAEVGIEKPDPRIFQIGCQRLGSRPNRTLFVGDHPTLDIRGAKDAGLSTAWMTRGRAWEELAFQPDHILQNLMDLLAPM